jgi:hypothetical protein
MGCTSRPLKLGRQVGHLAWRFDVAAEADDAPKLRLRNHHPQFWPETGAVEADRQYLSGLLCQRQLGADSPGLGRGGRQCHDGESPGGLR